MTRESIMEWLKVDSKRSVLTYAREHNVTPNEVWEVLLDKTP